MIGPVNRALITGDATDLPLAKQWLEAMVRLVPYEGGEHLRRLREAQPRLQ